MTTLTSLFFCSFSSDFFFWFKPTTFIQLFSFYSLFNDGPLYHQADALATYSHRHSVLRVFQFPNNFRLAVVELEILWRLIECMRNQLPCTPEMEIIIFEPK